jgi:hypothetical protein
MRAAEACGRLRVEPITRPAQPGSRAPATARRGGGAPTRNRRPGRLRAERRIRDPAGEKAWSEGYLKSFFHRPEWRCYGPPTAAPNSVRSTLCPPSPG